MMQRYKAALFGGVALQNIIVNGGNLTVTTGWTPSADNTLSAASGRLRNTLGTGNYAYAYQDVSFVSGHKYYFRANGYAGTSIDWAMQVLSSSIALLISTIAAIYSIIYNALATDTVRIKLMCNTLENAVYVEFNFITLIDLTAKFGAGNEPNLAWCDANIAPFVIY